MMNNNFSHKWQAFIGIALLSFGCYLDYTVVNIALPTIQLQLHADIVRLQWIMNIYFLALCILATIMGRCGDLYGRRRVFYIGVTIFTIASLIAGFAPNMSWLIIGRFLQGVGAAIVLPLGMSLLPESFPENERGKAIGWLGSVGGLALALGPLAGGAIVAYWGWRWIFFINVPMVIMGYLFCINAVKESKNNEGNRSLDWKGMLLMTGMMGGIVLGLIHAESTGWKNAITLSYASLAIVTGIALVMVENRQKNPLIEFKDFANPLFYAASVLAFFTGVLCAVTLFFDPLYLQVIRGQSPQLSGLVLFVIPVTLFIVATFIGWLIQRISLINILTSGILLATLAILLQVFFKESTYLWYILFAFIILGVVWALGNTVPIISAQSSVDPSRASVATGTIITLFNVGGSIGLALSVAAYQHFASVTLKTLPNITERLDYFQKLIANPAHVLQISIDSVDHNLFNHIFMNGFAGVMWVLLGPAIFLLVSLLISKRYVGNKR